jgi:hypothetical protein
VAAVVGGVVVVGVVGVVGVGLVGVVEGAGRVMGTD